MTDLKELRRLAEGATAGPWYQSGPPWFETDSGVLAGSPDPHIAPMIADCETWEGEREEWNENHTGAFKMVDASADAAYIAALSPDRVIALLDRVESLEVALKFYSDEKNWRRNGILDADGLNFIGMTIAEVALTEHKEQGK